MSRLRQSLGASFANATQMGLGFAALAVVSRFYPQSQLGIYFYLLGIVVVVESAAVGFFRAILKRAGEHTSEIGELTGIAAFVIGISVIGFTGIAFGLEILGVLSNPAFGILIFTGTAGSKGFLMVLGGSGRVAERAWIEAVRTFLRSGIWVFAGYFQLEVIWLGIGTAISGIIVMGVTLWIIGLPDKPSRKTLNSVSSFARYSVPQSIVGRGFGRVTPVLVGIILSPASVAAWTIINRVMIPSMIVPSALGQITIARSSEKVSKNKNHAKEISIGTYFTSILAVPITIGVIIIGDPVITTFFGSQYNDLSLLAGGIGVAKILESQSNVLSSGIEGRDNPRAVFKIAVVAVTVGIVGTILGASFFELLGVVFALICTAATRYLMLLNVSEVGYSKGLLNQLGAGLLMGAVIFGLKSVLGIPSTVWVFIYICTGGIIYAVSLITIDMELRSVIRSSLTAK